jgi:hypothetical protein
VPSNVSRRIRSRYRLSCSTPGEHPRRWKGRSSCHRWFRCACERWFRPVCEFEQFFQPAVETCHLGDHDDVDTAGSDVSQEHHIARAGLRAIPAGAQIVIGMGHAKRPALVLYVLGAFCELDVGVGGESLSIAGKAGAAGSSHGVMVAASTGGIEASTSLTPRCFGSFISMSR